MTTETTKRTLIIASPTSSPAPMKTYADINGVHYRFVREAMQDKDGLVPLSQLADDEIVISPGYVYRRMA